MCGGNKKGAATTTTSNTTASPEAMAAYRDILSRAQTLSQTPYEAYGGDRVAGFSPDQMAAFQSTRDAQGMLSPYIAEATGFARTGASPIEMSAIDRYRNPYEQTVVDKTLADLATQNAIAQQQVTGNAALRNALGGSRVGVAQALTAGEQARAQAPIIANLRASGWDKALGAAQQDRAAASSGASLLTGIGDAAHTGAYRDIGSLYGMGQQQQANTQAGLDTKYQDFLLRQAYPTQQLSWLSDIAGRTGTAMGSSTTGTKTDPAPNPWNSILGIGTAIGGAALGSPWLGSALGYGTTGGASLAGIGNTTKGLGFAHGGVVPKYQLGGPIEESGGMLESMGGQEGAGFSWPSLSNSLMHAGFAIAASPSPYLGQAIGQGGMAGVKAYSDNTKAEADKRLKEEQLRLQSEKLMQSAQLARDKLHQERLTPLGPSNDPARPGYWFYDKNSRNTVLQDISVAPRGGAAGARGVERDLANDLIAEAKARGETIDLEEGIRRARTIGRERLDAEITRRDRIAHSSVAAGTYPDIATARRSLGIPESLPPLTAGPRSAPGAPPAGADVPYDPTVGIPGAPPTRMRDVTGMRSAPADGPAFPGMTRTWERAGGPGAPVPGEPAHAPPAVRAPLPPPSAVAAPTGPTVRTPPPPKPAGMTDEQIRAAARKRIDDARARGALGEVDEILGTLRAWKVTP